MTAAEFSAIIARLGWTRDQAAAELGVTPHVVEAWERGSVRVPPKLAAGIRWQFAMVERSAIVDASGLPECGAAAELSRAMDRSSGEALVGAMEKFNEHTAACAVCQARLAYADRHGPPIPELPMPAWVRAMDRVIAAYNRLPASIRPPEGARGHGRRMGLFFGAAFSALALVITVVWIVARGASGDAWLDGGKGLAVISVGYFVGFYLAGLVYDLLHPIGERLIGYMLRWGLGAAMVYGTIGLVMPAVDDDPLSLPGVASFALFLGVVWSLIGAALWARRWWARRRARPAADGRST